MTDDAIRERTARSAESTQFENVLRTSTLPGLMPNLKQIDFGAMAGLAPWIAVVHPNSLRKTLCFTISGPGITQMQGQSILGADYLELFDPAYQGDAFDAAFVMMSKPCGLWQITPAWFDDGSEGFFEYTGFPVFDEEHSRGVIMFLIANTPRRLRRVRLVGHATEWEWIEMRSVSAA